MLCMSAKTFVDTNVLVYAHDNKEGHKQEAAKRILRGLAQQRSGAVSMQVLQEFYSTATRKLKTSLSRKYARETVDDLAIWCVEASLEAIRQACRIEDEAKIGFRDAMIVVAAIKSGATRNLTE